MMKTRILGGTLEVSPRSLECTGMSELHDEADERESIAVIHRSLELGVDFLDTADMVGPFTNEVLVGEEIRDQGDRVVPATTFGNERRPGGSEMGVNGRPDLEIT